ncbi:MAG: hypothetical protein ABJA10_04155 [Aestuariivirga sp.]
MRKYLTQKTLDHLPQAPTYLQGEGHPKVVWTGTTDQLDADSILSRPPLDRGRPNQEREDAKNFLLAALDDGPVEKSRIDRMAEARSISDITLRRAADDLTIVKSKRGKVSVWSLPPAKQEKVLE